MYKQIDANRRKTWILISLFVGLLAAVGYLYGYYSDLGYLGLVFALAISIGMTLFSWFAGDKVVLATSGAKEIKERDENPYLWNMVENLAITVGLPRPRIYVIADSAPNAFATGRSPEKASVAVTTGLISLLENEELEGVLAHELAHIQNQDTKVMMIAAVLVGSIVLLGDFFFRFGFLGRGRKNGHPIFMIVGIVLLVLSPFVAELIKLAISRKREYLADASGALMTRYPEGLARALEKISAHHRPIERVSRATAHLWIANPFAAKKARSLLSTHPPIEDRIHQLRKMGGAG
jgi:heat shock protein HtpX